ncbi:MAG: UbiA family prenyltransferase [Bacteroidales bacterium]|nr:UbiA family prenyltransferase [Bacteroidales bacterium]
MYAVIGRVYAAYGIEPALGPLLFFILVLVTVIIAAAGYIINDYFDLRTDRINKPESVVIGKYFPRRMAIKLHIVLNSIAIAAGFYLSLEAGSFRLWLLFSDDDHSALVLFRALQEKNSFWESRGSLYVGHGGDCGMVIRVFCAPATARQIYDCLYPARTDQPRDYGICCICFYSDFGKRNYQRCRRC